MASYEYTWKIGVEPVCSRELRTNIPVLENAVLTDLLTGDRYLVQTCYTARSQEKVWHAMPDAAIQTWPVDKLEGAELIALRNRARYEPDECCHPLGDIVFASAPRV